MQALEGHVAQQQQQITLKQQENARLLSQLQEVSPLTELGLFLDAVNAHGADMPSAGVARAHGEAR